MINTISSIHTIINDVANILQKMPAFIAHPSNELDSNGAAPELENKEYFAWEFTIYGYIIKFRVAKTTPKKIGEFVAFYKRNICGTIVPYDVADGIDFLIIRTQNDHQLGYFIVPTCALYAKGILSKDQIGGKRALRVYPPWSLADNRQAQETQAWQLKYFFEINPHTFVSNT